MNSKQRQVEIAGLRSYPAVASRRDWLYFTLTSLTAFSGFLSTQQTEGMSEKDWLYFHYEREPKGLAAVLGKLRTLPDRFSEFCRQKITVLPVHVIIFPNRVAYLRHLDKTLPKAPRRTSLFVVRGGKPTILAVDGDSLQRDLLHEATHAINFATFGTGQFPLWLDEGMAEWFEAEADEQAKTHGDLIKAIMGEQRTALAVPLKLTSLERIKTTTKADSLSYAASWAWCRFLGDPSTACHPIWLRYLSDVQVGIAAGKLSHRLALAVPNYEELFLRSLSLKTERK
ncbi:MAG: hypothetical protein CMJ76_08860 [Planctomycetaceae bacterium]|nr:hypothetical protein [Planctomycetaceae bacterium]|tara:strand:+ start:5576 stop:6430 length:855 start_codon:yes stop_codon:yes gene_type:complete